MFLSHEGVEAAKLAKHGGEKKEQHPTHPAVPSAADNLVSKYFREATAPLPVDEEEDFVIGVLGDYLKLKAQQHPNGIKADKETSQTGQQLAELESTLVGMMKRLHHVIVEHEILLQREEARERKKKLKRSRKSLALTNPEEHMSKIEEGVVKKGNVTELVRKREEEARRNEAEAKRLEEEEWQRRKDKWKRDRDFHRHGSNEATDPSLPSAATEGSLSVHHYHLSGVHWLNEKDQAAPTATPWKSAKKRRASLGLPKETPEQRDRRAKREEEESLILLRQWRVWEKMEAEKKESISPFGSKSTPDIPVFLNDKNDAHSDQTAPTTSQDTTNPKQTNDPPTPSDLMTACSVESRVDAHLITPMPRSESPAIEAKPAGT